MSNMILRPKHYTNKQLRSAFIDILKNAKTEIDMTIPWFGDYKNSNKLESHGFDEEVIKIV